jgi:hypothetical protein
VIGDRQIVRAVDHRVSLSKPGLLSALSRNSFSSASSPIFAYSDFHIDGGRSCPGAVARTKFITNSPTKLLYWRVIGAHSVAAERRALFVLQGINSEDMVVR